MSAGVFNASLCDSTNLRATVNYEKQSVIIFFSAPGPCSEGNIFHLLLVFFFNNLVISLNSYRWISDC